MEAAMTAVLPSHDKAVGISSLVRRGAIAPTEPAHRIPIKSEVLWPYDRWPEGPLAE